MYTKSNANTHINLQFIEPYKNSSSLYSNSSPELEEHVSASSSSPALSIVSNTGGKTLP